MNGVAHGDIASRLMASDFDLDAYRPYIGEDGRQYLNLTRNGETEAVPVHNANASMLIREWIQLDQAVIKAAVPRLKAVADLRGRGLTYNLPNGMGHSVLQSQRQSNVSPATISMDPREMSKGDRPVYDTVQLPLPIVHKDFTIGARELAISRNGNMPLDTSMAEFAARAVAEGVEQLLIGAGSVQYTYAGATCYGYCNFPSRLTKSLTLPTTTNQATTLAEVLDMRQKAKNALHTGPYILYTSLAWDAFLDGDYILSGGNVATQTLRQRLKAIEGIDDVVTLDYLVGYDMVLVQLTTNVVRSVIGFDVTTVQWETLGGMQLNFKVMAMIVPQLRVDFNSLAGVVHGSVSGQTTATTGVQYVSLNNP